MRQDDDPGPLLPQLVQGRGQTLDPGGVIPLLDHLARRGCHGALLCGTTGEGPSFSARERLDLWRAALEIRVTHPGFRLFAGTGTPSLDETIQLTRAAFDLGFEAAVVLPPYFFRQAPEDGLIAWYEAVLRRAVPVGGTLLGYHIPGVSGVPLSLDLLSRLRDRYPQFAGIKDSSADRGWAQALGTRFGSELFVLNGTDSLLDGTADPARDCNALSVGIGFTARQVGEPTREAPPAESSTGVCGDAGTTPPPPPPPVDAGTDAGDGGDGGEG